MPFVGLVIAMCFFFHQKRRWYDCDWGRRPYQTDHVRNAERDTERGRARANRAGERHGRRARRDPWAFGWTQVFGVRF